VGDPIPFGGSRREPAWTISKPEGASSGAAAAPNQGSKAQPIPLQPKEAKVQKLHQLFAEYPRREEGQTMAEYGVVLAVITIAVFGALALLSGNIVNAVNRVAGYIT
jgi:Flp pilus assembly pilin Flp